MQAVKPHVFWLPEVSPVEFQGGERAVVDKLSAGQSVPPPGRPKGSTDPKGHGKRKRKNW